jgi:hypothetical protein
LRHAIWRAFSAQLKEHGIVTSLHALREVARAVLSDNSLGLVSLLVDEDFRGPADGPEMGSDVQLVLSADDRSCADVANEN